MSEVQDIESRVIEIVAQALKHPVTRDTTRESTAAWDSLKHIELVFAIEDELQIRFDENELEALDSVQAFVERAQAKA